MKSLIRDGALVSASQSVSSLDLLDVNAACRALNVSRGTVYKALRKGNLKAIKIFSRTFFRREDLVDFVNRSVTSELNAAAGRGSK